jgi:hypothetical protein
MRRAVSSLHVRVLTKKSLQKQAFSDRGSRFMYSLVMRFVDRMV